MLHLRKDKATGSLSLFEGERLVRLIHLLSVVYHEDLVEKTLSGAPILRVMTFGEHSEMEAFAEGVRRRYRDAGFFEMAAAIKLLGPIPGPESLDVNQLSTALFVTGGLRSLLLVFKAQASKENASSRSPPARPVRRSARTPKSSRSRCASGQKSRQKT